MSKIDSWVTKVPRLKNSKVARFSYRAEAYANDDIEGVDSYDYARDMNVPLATHTDFESSMLSIGARANLSSVPKNGLNHFFGRVSYNLNKVIDFLSDLLDDFVSFTEVLYLSSSAALATYADGTTKRLLNTSSGIIDIALPVGESYNGSQIIKLEPYKLLVILKVGTTWINAGSGDGTAVDTIPAASEVYEGKILQYVGVTDEDYTSGWFYKCVETSPSVYEWIDIQVQDTPSNIITGFYENGKLWKGTNAEYLALDEPIRTNDLITFIITDIEADIPQLISDSTTSSETTWSSSKIEKLTKEVRSSASFTLDTFTDGTRLRIANTHAADTITIAPPSGQTIIGLTSIPLGTGLIVELELVGTDWKCPTETILINSLGNGQNGVIKYTSGRMIQRKSYYSATQPAGWIEVTFPESFYNTNITARANMRSYYGDRNRAVQIGDCIASNCRVYYPVTDCQILIEAEGYWK